MCVQHFTGSYRELSSPNSILFKVPKWSHIIDGQTEAWRGVVTCSESRWTGGGGVQDQSLVSCVRVSHLPRACCPSGWVKLKGPPREAHQQWDASLEFGRAPEPVNEHRAGGEGAPGAGHTWQRCGASSLEVGPRASLRSAVSSLESTQVRQRRRRGTGFWAWGALLAHSLPGWLPSAGAPPDPSPVAWPLSS